MSRLDNFEEILKSYEGKEFDPIRRRLSADARKIYDSLNPEFQQSVLKYFTYAIKLDFFHTLGGNFGIRPLETNPDYFDECVLDFGKATQSKLAEIQRDLNMVIEWYERDEERIKALRAEANEQTR